MGRNWSKDKARFAAAKSRLDKAREIDEVDYLLRGHVPEPTKEELRAQAAEAVAAYQGEIKRLPTVMRLECLCGHRGRVLLRDDQKSRRFKCSKCGARL